MTFDEAWAVVERINEEFVKEEGAAERRGLIGGIYEGDGMRWYVCGDFGTLAAVIVQGITKSTAESMEPRQAIQAMDAMARQLKSMIRARVYGQLWGGEETEGGQIQ